jgi:hypothetical protein
MKRIAITLPEDQARAIARIRKKRQTPRSRVIQQAVAYYLSEQALLSAVREYVKDYRRFPENATEVEALGNAAAEVLTPEEWG